MTFKYKKSSYENIFEWADSDQGTCFYCQKDKKIRIKLVGDKGVCYDCLNDFEVGHLGTDRHIVYAIMPKFTSHKEAERWFHEELKVQLILKDIMDDTFIYECVNDPDAFKRVQKKIEHSDGVAPFDEAWMNASTVVEISKNGAVHIIY